MASDTPPTGTAIPRPRLKPITPGSTVYGLDRDEPPPLIPKDEAVSPPPPAELDADVRLRLADAIARTITAELGTVRISSVPPKPPDTEPPRSSMRAAARGAGKAGKWTVYASGALALLGQVIVWTMKPEYAAPLAQAAKLIAAAIVAAAGGGAPATPELSP